MVVSSALEPDRTLFHSQFWRDLGIGIDMGRHAMWTICDTPIRDVAVHGKYPDPRKVGVIKCMHKQCAPGSFFSSPWYKANISSEYLRSCKVLSLISATPRVLLVYIILYWRYRADYNYLKLPWLCQTNTNVGRTWSDIKLYGLI